MSVNVSAAKQRKQRTQLVRRIDRARALWFSGVHREARRAAELRANLARRKAQARARAELQGSAQAAPEAERPDED